MSTPEDFPSSNRRAVEGVEEPVGHGGDGTDPGVTAESVVDQGVPTTLNTSVSSHQIPTDTMAAGITNLIQ